VTVKNIAIGGTASQFGAYRLERQRAACASWPRAPRDPQLMEQRKSNVPVLFIAGELDPVAPADWTRELAKYFPRGRVASIPHGGHMPDGLSGLDTCLDATVLKFYDTADAQALDLSTATVGREQRLAVAWLHREMSSGV